MEPRPLHNGGVLGSGVVVSPPCPVKSGLTLSGVNGHGRRRCLQLAVCVQGKCVGESGVEDGGGSVGVWEMQGRLGSVLNAEIGWK